MSAPFLFLLALFLLLGAIGMPIGFAMLVSGIGYLFASGQDVGLAAEQVLNGLYNSFVLLAVPLFIFAANVMNAGTISDRLLVFSLAIVGRFRGGLAHVNVVASLIFSGMSGSAIADAAGIARELIDPTRGTSGSSVGRYQPASTISLPSISISPPAYSAVKATINESGNGHGWLPK